MGGYHSQQPSNHSQYHDAPSTPPATDSPTNNNPNADDNDTTPAAHALAHPRTRTAPRMHIQAPSLDTGPVPFPSFRAGSEPPTTAADDARAQYAIARGRQPGPGQDHDEGAVKKEGPESEADSVVVVGSASPEQAAQTQADGSGFGAPGAPVDAPA